MESGGSVDEGTSATGGWAWASVDEFLKFGVITNNGGSVSNAGECTGGVGEIFGISVIVGVGGGPVGVSANLHGNCV